MILVTFQTKYEFDDAHELLQKDLDLPELPILCEGGMLGFLDDGIGFGN